MYFGEPYKITYEGGEIEVLQPTIGNILNFGERNFYSMLNVFIANTTSYRLQLWSMGEDWNKISDYELFCMLIKSLDVESTKVLFGELDFRLFDLYSKKIDDTEVVTLYNKEQQVEIDENTYIANAMMRIDELVEFFDLDETQFEEDDVETIAGLVVKLLGRIADIGDTVSFNGFTFTVNEIDGARITKLKLYKEPAQEPANSSEEL